MRSIILRTIAQGILPVTTLFAVYLLLRGHNEPGGGFIAGLVTASAIVLQALAFGADWARARLTRIIRPAFGWGLVIAGASGFIAVAAGDPYLKHYHWHMPLPGEGYVHLSTTLIFDIGVYMVVVATAAMVVSIFAEEAA